MRPVVSPRHTSVTTWNTWNVNDRGGGPGNLLPFQRPHSQSSSNHVLTNSCTTSRTSLGNSCQHLIVPPENKRCAFLDEFWRRRPDLNRGWSLAGRLDAEQQSRQHRAHRHWTADRAAGITGIRRATPSAGWRRNRDCRWGSARGITPDDARKVGDVKTEVRLEPLTSRARTPRRGSASRWSRSACIASSRSAEAGPEGRSGAGARAPRLSAGRGCGAHPSRRAGAERQYRSTAAILWCRSSVPSS